MIKLWNAHGSSSADRLSRMQMTLIMWMLSLTAEAELLSSLFVSYPVVKLLSLDYFMFQFGESPRPT
jgi:hypothetical protein